MLIPLWIASCIFRRSYLQGCGLVPINMAAWFVLEPDPSLKLLELIKPMSPIYTVLSPRLTICLPRWPLIKIKLISDYFPVADTGAWQTGRKVSDIEMAGALEATAVDTKSLRLTDLQAISQSLLDNIKWIIQPVHEQFDKLPLSLTPKRWQTQYLK